MYDPICVCFEMLMQLDTSMNLVHQCIAGTGMVQINVELKRGEVPPRLNIVDVLQPLDDVEDGSGHIIFIFLWLSL